MALNRGVSHDPEHFIWWQWIRITPTLLQHNTCLSIKEWWTNILCTETGDAKV
jgi:hypothetical protein